MSTLKRGVRSALEQTGLGRRFLTLYFLGAQKKVVHAELRRLKSELDLDPSTTVRIVYDNRVSPPTYGDLYNVIMMARLLALLGHNVEFVFIDAHERRADWTDLDQVQTENFVRDQVDLARFLLPLDVTLELWTPEGDFAGKLVADGYFTLFPHRVGGREPIYPLIPYFLRVFAAHHSSPLPEGFLLGRHTMPEESPCSPHANAPYVAWHVRKGLWSQERNPVDDVIASDFAELRELFPHHDVVVLSSPSGIDHALDVLSRSGQIGNDEASGSRVFGQPESGFIGAIPWVLGADFYFQRLGGGVGQIAIFSTVPYIYLSNDSVAAASFGVVGDSSIPWSREDQNFAVYPSLAGTIKLSDVLADVPRFSVGLSR